MYALVDISNQMLEDGAFDHAGATLRKSGLAVAINEMLTYEKGRRGNPPASFFVPAIRHQRRVPRYSIHLKGKPRAL